VQQEEAWGDVALFHGIFAMRRARPQKPVIPAIRRPQPIKRGITANFGSTSSASNDPVAAIAPIVI
jgi:hypothetical protein